jgi:hypothetical protein
MSRLLSNPYRSVSVDHMGMGCGHGTMGMSMALSRVMGETAD